MGISEDCPRATGDRPNATKTRLFFSRREAALALEPLGMQQLIKLSCSPEQYAEMGREHTVSRPALCPNCERGGTLEAHGYYCRWVSALKQAGRVVQIRVRRFFVAIAGAP